MRIRYQIMLLSVAVLGVYYPAIFAPLSSVDDPGLIRTLLNTENLNLSHIFLPGGTSGYYRPLLIVSFYLDKSMWGLQESFLHLTNILLHLGNTLLVFAVALRVSRLGGRASCGPAFVAALLFAVHPINVESVCWISGRTDPLAAFFLLLSVLALLYRSRPLLSATIAALLMLLACLVKETAIFYLPAALLFPFYAPDGSAQKAALPATFLRSLPHFAVFLLSAAAYFLLRTLALAQGDEGISHVVRGIAVKQSPELLLRVRMVLKAVGFYGKKLVAPLPLNFAITHVPDGYLFLGVLVCAALLFLALRRTLLSFFWVSAASIGASAILIGLLNVTWTPLAERYMYIPSAFFLIGLTLSIQQWHLSVRYRNYLVATACLLVVFGLYGTFSRTLLWQDNLAFFRDAVRQSPDFPPARNELATALNSLGRTQEAIDIYKSYQVSSDVKNYQYGMMSKAAVYEDQGDSATARKILREALKKPGKLEVMILERLMEINKLEVLRGKETAEQVYSDSVVCLTRLHVLTGDPFYQYRLGVINLQGKHDRLALDAFRIVCRTAHSDIYYRKPAEKLASKLALKLDGPATEGNRKL